MPGILNIGLGVGQVWNIVTGSRIAGTTYYNQTGKPILICVSFLGSAANCSINVGGSVVSVATSSGSSVANGVAIVPIGSSYNASGVGSLYSWAELS
jgi:hypothetical protein